MRADPRPLTGPPPAEIPLPRAPLVRVIAQVRFPTILAIRNPDKTAGFQDAIRKTYPTLTEDRVHHVVVAPGGEPEVREVLIWRFADRERKPTWRVSLGVDFMALETTAYVSRADFLDRFRNVAAGLEKTFAPSAVNRLGLRYIDRIQGEAIDRIDELVRPAALGISGSGDASSGALAGALVHMLTDAQFVADEGVIRARWGSLPRNATHDPDALEPIGDPSWILDLDMFAEERREFTGESLCDAAGSFAKRVYAVFRDMVTEEFLKHYGGNHDRTCQ